MLYLEHKKTFHSVKSLYHQARQPLDSSLLHLVRLGCLVLMTVIAILLIHITIRPQHLSVCVHGVESGLAVGGGVQALVVQLVVHLGGHASNEGVEHDMRGDSSEVRQVFQFLHKDGQDVAHTGQQLQAIAQANELVVAGVGAEVILVHDCHARGGHAQTQTQDRLQPKTHVRTGLLPHLPWLETEAADVPLTAQVFAHVAIKNTVSSIVSTTRSTQDCH